MYHGSNTPFPTQACAVAAAPASTLDDELNILSNLLIGVEKQVDDLCSALSPVSRSRPPAPVSTSGNDLPLPEVLERVRSMRWQLNRIAEQLGDQQARLAIF